MSYTRYDFGQKQNLLDSVIIFQEGSFLIKRKKGGGLSRIVLVDVTYSRFGLFLLDITSLRLFIRTLVFKRH